MAVNRNPSLKGEQLNPHTLPKFGIQVAQRLIEENELWFRDQGACQGHPLLLPTAQICCRSMGEVTQPNQFQYLLNLLLDPLFPLLPIASTERQRY